VVLCDVGPDHMIDVDDARGRINSATKAVMPVQLNGSTADMDAVQALSREHGLLVVEDSCQAFGARYKGRPAGTFGVAGSFSFYPAKTLGCFGDGGGMVFTDVEVAERAKAFRDHGRLGTGEIEDFGINGRLDNVQAAILSIKLRHYDEAISTRRRLAALYCDALMDLEEITLPTHPDSDPDRFDIFQNLEIRAERRDDLRDFLLGRGIGTISQWGGRMLHQLNGLGLGSRVSFAEDLSASFMLLPLHHLLTDGDVEYVSEQVRKFYRG
jgi:dTDP-4-amino-4,6-dideoxygalactose transaminase